MMEFVRNSASVMSMYRRKPIAGVGINDSWYICESKDEQGKRIKCPIYARWYNMILRCYSVNVHNTRPSYKDCYVCDEWLTFSSFAKWMELQDWIGKHLDKDIIVTGNKIYSPDTCIFVDGDINALLLDNESFRGKYKQGVGRSVGGKFVSYCNVMGNRERLGAYITEDEASKVYIDFKSKHIYGIAQKQEQPLRGYLERISMELRNKA